MERCPALNVARRVSRLVTGILLAAAIGCSNSESTDPSAETDANGKPAVAFGPPDQTLLEFMMAFKNGDDAKASALLSEKTRQEVERTQMGVTPPGSPEMQFKVGGVEYVSEAKDLAHVVCHIANKNPDGELEEIDVVWALRKEQPGWRIAGLAMKIFDDQPPVFYNFEDMDDMQRKIDLVSEEMVRRATQTLTSEQQPSAETPAGQPAANVAEFQDPTDGVRKQ